MWESTREPQDEQNIPLQSEQRERGCSRESSGDRHMSLLLLLLLLLTRRSPQ